MRFLEEQLFGFGLTGSKHFLTFFDTFLQHVWSFPFALPFFFVGGSFWWSVLKQNNHFCFLPKQLFFAFFGWL